MVDLLSLKLSFKSSFSLEEILIVDLRIRHLKVSLVEKGEGNGSKLNL